MRKKIIPLLIVSLFFTFFCYLLFIFLTKKSPEKILPKADEKLAVDSQTITELPKSQPPAKNTSVNRPPSEDIDSEEVHLSLTPPPTFKKIPREKLQQTRKILNKGYALPLENLFLANHLLACNEPSCAQGNPIRQINSFNIYEKVISPDDLNKLSSLVIVDKKYNKIALWNKVILVHTDSLDSLKHDLKSFPEHKMTQIHPKVYALTFNLDTNELTKIIQQLKETSSINKVELDLLYDTYETK